MIKATMIVVISLNQIMIKEAIVGNWFSKTVKAAFS